MTEHQILIPPINESVGKTERFFLNEKERGRMPTPNNKDLIKEMTHLLHASAFTKTTAQLTRARSQKHKHIKAQTDTEEENINLHVSTGSESSSRVNVSGCWAATTLKP